MRQVVLIVTEDSKASVAYFDEIRAEQRIPDKNCRICAGSGSDPVAVVNTAITLRQDLVMHSRIEPSRVFVVIDRDAHANYNQALADLRQANTIAGTTGSRRIKRWDPPAKDSPKERFELILSDPCFELSLLLHYMKWSTPFVASGGRSVCEVVIHELKSRGYLVNYHKGLRSVWTHTRDLYEMHGRPNAIETNRLSDISDRTNPSTKIYEVVDVIRSM